MPREPPVTIAVFPSSENEGPCAHTPASLPRAYDARVAEPRKFFWTPHYERHDWVLVRLAAIDRADLGELLRDAWALRAPPSLRARAPR